MPRTIPTTTMTVRMTTTGTEMDTCFSRSFSRVAPTVDSNMVNNGNQMTYLDAFNVLNIVNIPGCP